MWSSQRELRKTETEPHEAAPNRQKSVELRLAFVHHRQATARPYHAFGRVPPKKRQPPVRTPADPACRKRHSDDAICWTAENRNNAPSAQASRCQRWQTPPFLHKAENEQWNNGRRVSWETSLKLGAKRQPALDRLKV